MNNYPPKFWENDPEVEPRIVYFVMKQTGVSAYSEECDKFTELLYYLREYLKVEDEDMSIIYSALMKYAVLNSSLNTDNAIEFIKEYDAALSIDVDNAIDCFNNHWQMKKRFHEFNETQTSIKDVL